MKIIIIKITHLLLLLTVINSCIKENDIAVFKGITEITKKGEILSVDSTDWTFNETWSQKEINLFNVDITNFCAVDNNYSIIAFPNPTFDVIFFEFNNLGDMKLSYRIVNRDFDILMQQNNVSTYPFGIPASDMVRDEVIRIYYILQGENCQLRGHGDIDVF